MIKDNLMNVLILLTALAIATVGMVYFTAKQNTAILAGFVVLYAIALLGAYVNTIKTLKTIN